MNSSLIWGKPNLSDIPVMPFTLFYDYFDYQIILYLKDHPEYEAIEAMIKEGENEETFIAVIVTLHDQTQIHYLNDKDTVEEQKKIFTGTQFYYSPMEYMRTENEGKTNILIKFISSKCECIIFNLYAASPAQPESGGLTDPGGHAATTSFPIMFRERSALADLGCSMLIHYVKCKKAKEPCLPKVYTGTRGFYSEEFKIGVWRDSFEHIEVIQSPSNLNVGAKWVYNSKQGEMVYEIAEIQGDMFVIKSEDKEITARITDDRYEIIKITIFSNIDKDNVSAFTIEFKPLLPIFSSKPVQMAESDFSVSIDTHNSLVTGVATSEINRKSTILLLKPVNPEWAVKRPVYTEIEKRIKTFIIKTDVAREG